MYYVKLNQGDVEGFYIEDLHGTEICTSIYEEGGLKIDDELHEYLLTLNSCRFTGVKEDRDYTISDKDSFTAIISPPDNTPQLPTQEDRLAALEAALMGVL